MQGNDYLCTVQFKTNDYEKSNYHVTDGRRIVGL